MTASAPPPYPPYAYGPAQPPAPAEPGRVARLFAGILAIVAAALVVTGSFLPQTSFGQTIDGRVDSRQQITSWTRTFDIPPSADAQTFYDHSHVARYGIPLSAGALLLLAGAVLAFAGARREGVKSWSRIALLIGGGGIAGAVWMLSMDVSATLSYEETQGTITTNYATGLGFWLVLGGGVVAVLVLLFAILAGRKPAAPASFAPYQPSAPYPAQQPYGYAAPPSQPFAAQPYPYGAPQSQPFPAQPYAAPQSQPFPAQPPRQEKTPTEPNYQLPPLDPPNT